MSPVAKDYHCDPWRPDVRERGVCPNLPEANTASEEHYLIETAANQDRCALQNHGGEDPVGPNCAWQNANDENGNTHHPIEISSSREPIWPWSEPWRRSRCRRNDGTEAVHEKGITMWEQHDVSTGGGEVAIQRSITTTWQTVGSVAPGNSKRWRI